MKSIAYLLLVGLFLLSFAAPRLRAAGNSGPAANGDFQFSLDDGTTRYLTFDVRTNKDGVTKGTMNFTDPSTFADPNGDGSAEVSNVLNGIFVTAEFDCLQIHGKSAVMGGVITQSNALNAVGQRILLVVQDNGEGINAASNDRLTWGVYRPATQSWIPRDAEVENDNGAFLSWVATDSERSDDVGVPSNKNQEIGCQSFPLSSYSFVDLQHGSGNVQVKP